MKKRLAIGCACLVAVLVVAVLVDPTYVLFGIVKTETFFNGRPTSYWREQVRRLNSEAHRSFGIELGGSPNPEAVPVLRELLQDQDDQVCFFACNALAIIGRDANAATAELADLLAHPNLFHRRNAAVALAAIAGPGDLAALAALIKGLQEEDTFINYHCAIALGHIGPGAKGAIPLLVKLSKGDRAGLDIFDAKATHGTLGDACLWALCQIDPKAFSNKEIFFNAPNRSRTPVMNEPNDCKALFFPALTPGAG